MLKKVTIVAMALVLCLAFGYSNASAEVNVTRGGIGDGLIFDLYDIRTDDLRTDAWQNYFVIENTSGNWTAAHLRLRGWKKSIEVWDHVILLSPRDVFFCVLQRATEAGTTTDGVDYPIGAPIIWSTDTNTLKDSGLIYDPDTVFTDLISEELLRACGFTTDVQDELEAGYLEVIGLWSLQKPAYYAGPDDTHELVDVVGDLFTNTTKDNGAINIYDVLEAGFYAFTTPTVKTQSWPAEAIIADDDATVPGANDVELGLDGQRRALLDCGNVLAGSLERGDLGSGRYEMGNFLALRNFRTTTITAEVHRDGSAEVHRDGSALGAIVFPTLALNSEPYNVGQGNPATNPAIETAWYVNESYSSTNGPGWRDGDDIFGANAGIAAFNDIWSLDDVEVALECGNLWNHFYNMHNGADYWTDLVLTFPTKHYHWVFADWPWWNEDSQPNEGWFDSYESDVVSKRAGVAGVLAGFGNGPVGAWNWIWNMDEDSIIPPPLTPSPRPPDFDDPIPHEVNLILIGDNLGLVPRPGYGEGIHEADPVLYTEYHDGQFTIGPFILQNGDRNRGFTVAHPIYGLATGPNPTRYFLPSVQEIIFTHAYVGDVAIRSTTTPVKFDHVFELDGQLLPNPWGAP